MKQAILKIYSPIDNYGWQLYRVRSFLAEHAKDDVIIEVNSLGGSVNDAMMISKEIADHGNVTVRLLAFCASATTWMGFGAKKVEIADDALWLCHQSSVLVSIYSSLNKDDIDKTIEDLQKSKKLVEATDLIIARKYLDKAQKNGKDTTLDKVVDLMKEEKWMTAQEVVDLGFADAIISGAKSMTNEVRQFFVQNHAALNMPKVPEDTAAPREEKESLMDKVKNIVQEILGTDSKVEKPIDNPIINNKKKATMKKFVLLNALLALSELTVNDDGKVSLTEEQLEAIENALSAKKTADDELAAAGTACDSISENVKAISGLSNKILAVKAVLDRTPLVAPAAPAPASPEDSKEEQEAKALKESAVDEINQEAQSL